MALFTDDDWLGQEAPQKRKRGRPKGSKSSAVTKRKHSEHSSKEYRGVRRARRQVQFRHTDGLGKEITTAHQLSSAMFKAYGRALEVLVEQETPLDHIIAKALQDDPTKMLAIMARLAPSEAKVDINHTVTLQDAINIANQRRIEAEEAAFEEVGLEVDPDAIDDTKPLILLNNPEKVGSCTSNGPETNEYKS